MSERPEFEEAEIREIRNSPREPEGQSVVRIRKSRKWLLPIVAGAILVLFLLLLLSGSSEKEGVSLRAAQEILLEEEPPLQKDDVLRILSQEGFLVSPGKPRSKLEIGVAVRREGITLRSQGGRLLISWSDFR